MSTEFDATERPAEKEHFGEASLGEAQSSNPPADPEMLRDEATEAPAADGGGEPAGGDDPSAGGSDSADGGAEQYGGDQDAEPSESGIDSEGQPS